LKDRNTGAKFLPKNITAHIIWAIRAYCHGELLSRGVKTELEIMEFLKIIVLKDIIYSADLACVRKATPTNIANCWK
jgi:hypothetical protein